MKKGKVCTLNTWVHKVFLICFKVVQEQTGTKSVFYKKYPEFCKDFDFWVFSCHNSPHLRKFTPRSLKILKSKKKNFILLWFDNFFRILNQQFVYKMSCKNSSNYLWLNCAFITFRKFKLCPFDRIFTWPIFRTSNPLCSVLMRNLMKV